MKRRGSSAAKPEINGSIIILVYILSNSIEFLCMYKDVFYKPDNVDIFKIIKPKKCREFEISSIELASKYRWPTNW